MFNFDKFLSMMKRNGCVQIAVSNGYPRNAKRGELSVSPVSMPGWTFVFVKKQ